MKLHNVCPWDTSAGKSVCWVSHGFYFCDKTQQPKPSRGREYLFYIYSLYLVHHLGKLGQKLSMSTHLRRNWCRGQEGTRLTVLHFIAWLLRLLLCATQDQIPGVAPLTVGWNLPHQSFYRLTYRLIQWKHFLNFIFFLDNSDSHHLKTKKPDSTMY